MTTPVRLQRQRHKGFNLQALSMETNGLPAVSVCRPSIFGNPFTMKDAVEVGYVRDPKEKLATLFLVDCFADWISGSDKWWTGPVSEQRRKAVISRLGELRGKNLACFCRLDQPCHADVLLEIANR